MVLPEVFSPGEPQGTETVASGPAKIAANWQALADFLGIPVTPTSLTAPAFSITGGGVVTISQAGALLVADPTVALGIASKQYVDNHLVPNGAATGTNSYVVTLTPVPSSQAALLNILILVFFANANTGPCTLNANSLGVQNILKNGVALAAGDIVANSWQVLTWGGTNYQLVAQNPDADLYGVRNLTGLAGPGTTFAISGDLVTTQNPANRGLAITSAFSATLDISVSGPALNGRDQAGAFGATSTVHIYAITGPGQTAGLLASNSAPATGPTLPTNYTNWAYLCSVILIGGNFSGQVLRGNSVYLLTSGSNNVISAVDVTTLTGGVNESTTAIIPVIALDVRFFVALTITSTGNRASATVTTTPFTAGDTGLPSWSAGYNGSGTGGCSGEITMPNTGNITVQTTADSFGGGSSGALTISAQSYTVPNNC